MRNIVAGAVPLGNFQQSDAEQFIAWMWKQKEATSFDPAVLTAPRACMVKASRDDRTIFFAPIQPVLAIESLCRDEKASKSELTLALYEMHKLVQRIMRDTLHAEAFFTTSIDSFADLAENNGWQKHLFDEKKHTWLMKLQIPGIPTCESL